MNYPARSAGVTKHMRPHEVQPRAHGMVMVCLLQSSYMHCGYMGDGKTWRAHAGTAASMWPEHNAS